MFAPEGRPLYLIVLFLILSFATNFQDSYSNSYVNTAYDGFQKYFNESYIRRGNAKGLSKWDWTWLWSVFLNIWTVGMMVGNFVTPYLTDVYGRKKALIVAAIISLVGTSLAVVGIFVRLPELVLVARTIASVSTGISFTTLYVFIQETSPTNLRGTCSFLVQNTYLFINVIGFILGWDIILGNHVGLLTAVGIIPGIFALILLLPMKETPKFLVIHEQNKAEAIESLQHYQGKSIDIKESLNIITKEAEDEKLNLPLLKALIVVVKVRYLRKALLVGIMAFNLINPVWTILYLSSMLLEANFSDSTSQYISFGYIVAQFLSGIVGAFIADRIGRRPMILISGTLNTLTILVYVLFDRLAFYFGSWYKYGCVGSLIAYGITYGVAVGPFCYFISTELTPQKYRSLIQSINMFINNIISLIITFLALPAYNWIDIWCFIPLFVIPSAISLVYIGLVMPESKGKEIYEIVEELKGSKNKVYHKNPKENDVKLKNHECFTKL